MSSPGLSGVPEHGSVDRVREVALEDTHGLSTSEAMCAGLVVDLAGPGFVAELDAHFAELARPARAKRPTRLGVLATPSEAAAAADAGRPLHPLILTSFRFVAR
jgi:hypothetical protein